MTKKRERARIVPDKRIDIRDEAGNEYVVYVRSTFLEIYTHPGTLLLRAQSANHMFIAQDGGMECAKVGAARRVRASSGRSARR